MVWFYNKQLGNYNIGKKLGQGKFSTVRLATQKDTGEVYAMKIINKSGIKTEMDWIRIRRETEVLTNLDHPHIVNLIEVFETEDSMCIILDYAEGGDLFNKIIESKEERLSIEESFSLFRQMVSAMDYCHSHFVVHRDLKPENIFLTDEGSVKIGDFGFARTFSPGDPMTTPCGSFSYAAPEVITGKKYLGAASDVWSLGCVLYTMLVGRLPFRKGNHQDELLRIKKGRFIDSEYLINDDTREFFSRVFNPIPSERMTTKEMSKHKVIWQDKPLLGMLIRPFAGKIQDNKQTRLDTSFSDSYFRQSQCGKKIVHTKVRKKVHNPSIESSHVPKIVIEHPKMEEIIKDEIKAQSDPSPAGEGKKEEPPEEHHYISLNVKDYSTKRKRSTSAFKNEKVMMAVFRHARGKI